MKTYDFSYKKVNFNQYTLFSQNLNYMIRLNIDVLH